MQEGAYDVMQVCLNGHRINSSSRGFPQHNKNFCPDCGEATIQACPSCECPIKGHLIGAFTINETPVRAFCDNCGMPYPWQISKVDNAVELLRLKGLDEGIVQEVEKNLPAIVRDTPKTEVAVLRMKQALEKAGKPLYDIGIKVISDVAAATAKSYLGLPK